MKDKLLGPMIIGGSVIISSLIISKAQDYRIVSASHEEMFGMIQTSQVRGDGAVRRCEAIIDKDLVGVRRPTAFVSDDQNCTDWYR